MDENNAVVEQPVAVVETPETEDSADSNTRLYRARTVLTYLDTGTFRMRAAKISVRAPTPVFDSDDRHIGFASVRVEDDRVEADLTIEYDNEERLLAETGAGLYARFFGRMLFSPLPLLDLQRPLEVLRVDIDGIKLTTQKPSDLRLQPLGPRE